MIHEWPTVIELAESIRRGERKATETARHRLAAIDAGNEPLNAFVHVDVDSPGRRPRRSTRPSPQAATPVRWPACRSA